jgi:imidazolonepropionase-like amidohydrolase
LLSIEPLLNDEDAFDFLVNPAAQEKWIEVTDATNVICSLAKDVGVNIAFGTDLPMDRELAPSRAVPREAGELVHTLRSPQDSDVGERDAARPVRAQDVLSGQTLCGIQEGACADMILVYETPLEDLDLVADPEVDFVVIMKDGVVYKNALR